MARSRADILKRFWECDCDDDSSVHVLGHEPQCQECGLSSEDCVGVIPDVEKVELIMVAQQCSLKKKVYELEGALSVAKFRLQCAESRLKDFREDGE